ncbi:tRNA (guanosine(37)-N1)-methyltransferase TrmD [Candidatus Synchoanobacter obligatus]|uniref:tRNA (guanine-N(1)-)-methyltransferase n=1 Tax=Candidatus Synchoanobacter obligatus TaxID=2919597 RepID=A0ABT1L5S5_9GAMM|nr:tRNA (guanosine(37)-N1)-methyltransferase TrmD [Candidatus Synchoanobacter obligatus]MCP8352524.1 tRNA (guanosine(37)-N1)-methyltransferase TrmD [Candidatus Synchoanobacter obligatus]
MIINVITSIPDILDAANHGILGHAIKNKQITLNIIPLRAFSDRADGRIDDRPYGGGAGMVIQPHVMSKAIASIGKSHFIELCPKGQRLNQKLARSFAKKDNITLICGRYEGIDARIEPLIDQKVSIGDYVLSGGELPALIMIDAIGRLIPGVIKTESVENDSFENGLLDHEHYTRPENWEENKVPSVLLEGNHQKIEDYRLMQSLGKTWLNRPDLLLNRKLNERELALLVKFMQNHQRRGEDYD